MTDQEVAALLVFLNELDGRHSPNEIKVRAWVSVFDESAPGMTVTFARDVARRHYSLLDDMITPSAFVRAWRLKQGLEQVFTESHCRKADCGCTHRVCYRGWIDLDDGTTQPCGVCRQELAAVLAEIPPPGQRSEQDWVKVRLRKGGV